MIETQTESGLGTWAVPQCPFRIEYVPRVLDDIRLAVVDAFFSLPRGGAEIGGVLLGRLEDMRLVISDYLPLDCEHAFGPSFTLSQNDEAALRELLARRPTNGDGNGHGNGSLPVGWYHSHTRSEIFLSEADQDIHRRYFSEPWQVALVLKPHTFHPMRGGFFFREPDGTMHAAASYQEFEVEPLPVRPLPPLEPPVLENHSHARRYGPVPDGPVITIAADPQAPTMVPPLAGVPRVSEAMADIKLPTPVVAATPPPTAEPFAPMAPPPAEAFVPSAPMQIIDQSPAPVPAATQPAEVVEMPVRPEPVAAQPAEVVEMPLRPGPVAAEPVEVAAPAAEVVEMAVAPELVAAPPAEVVEVAAAPEPVAASPAEVVEVAIAPGPVAAPPAEVVVASAAPEAVAAPPTEVVEVAAAQEPLAAPPAELAEGAAAPEPVAAPLTEVVEVSAALEPVAALLAEVVEAAAVPEVPAPPPINVVEMPAVVEPAQAPPAEVVAAAPVSPEPIALPPAATFEIPFAPEPTTTPYVAPAPAPVFAPAPVAAESPVLSSFQNQPERSFTWLKVVLAAAAGFGLGTLVLNRQPSVPAVQQAARPAPPAAPAGPPPSIGLNVADQNGQLQILWDANSLSIRNATDGLLEITEAGLPQVTQLNPAQLRTGTFTYARQSKKVSVKLTAHQPLGQPVREAAMFVAGDAPPPVKAPSDPGLRKERDDLARRLDAAGKEAARLRSDLAAQNARNRKLDQTVQDLRKQLANQQRKRLTNQTADR